MKLLKSILSLILAAGFFLLSGGSLLIALYTLYTQYPAQGLLNSLLLTGIEMFRWLGAGFLCLILFYLLNPKRTKTPLQ